MADTNVEYTIRLKDQMTRSLKKMGLSVSKLRRKLKTGLAGGLKVASKALKMFAIGAAAAAAAAAAVGFAAVRMGQSFVTAASMAEETRSKFEIVFKGVSNEANQMADDIASGLKKNRTEVQGFMAGLQDTFVPLGLSREKALELSGAVVSLGYDLTSFSEKMKTPQQTMDLLQSGLIGNVEVFRNFGVAIDENTTKAKLMEMGAQKVNGAYTQQDKILARVQLVMDGTADAQGNLLQTADSWKNTTIELTGKLTAVREEIGARLIPQILELVAGVGGVDGVVSMVSTGFEFFGKVLTQIVIPTIGSLMSDFSKFITAMGGIDESVIAVSETVSLLSKVFSVTWDSIKLVLYYFQQGLDTIKFVVLALWAVIKLLSQGLAYALVGGLKLAAEGVAFLLGGLDKLTIFIKDSVISVFQGLLNTLADVVQGIASTLNWMGKFAVVPDAIGEAGKTAGAAAEGLRSFSAASDLLKGGESPYAQMAKDVAAFGESLAPVQDQLAEFINETWTELGEVSNEWVDAIMEDVPAIEELYASIREGAEGIGTDYAALADKVSEALEGLSEVEIVTPEQADRVAAMEEHLQRLQAPIQSVADAQAEAAAAGMTLTDAFDIVGNAATDFATKEIPSMADSLKNITEGAMTSFADGMTDALMSMLDGSKSAGEAFKEFAASFLMDVSRMIIQALVFKAIRSALGIPLADGGVVSGGLGDLEAFANGGAVAGGLGRFVPVKGYATGGPIVNKPHVALIGEGQHNEAVVPLPDGRSIPVDMSGAPETQVSINIQAVDGASVDRMLFDRRDTLRSLISSAIAESRSFRGAIARA